MADIQWLSDLAEQSKGMSERMMKEAWGRGCKLCLINLPHPGKE